MIIKEKRYIKKCDCGTEIIYTRRDCYHNTTWDIYSLYCPSCSHEYSYRRGTHHDLFDKEYEEDSVDKDEEIERLNNIINELEKWLDTIPNYFMDSRSNNNGVYIQKGMKQQIDMTKQKIKELKGEDKE